jgi:hypothetical protein
MRQIQQSLEIHATLLRVMENLHRAGGGKSFPAIEAPAIHSLTMEHQIVTKGERLRGLCTAGP